MSKAPLVDNLKNIVLKSPVSFHTPGHKSGQLIPTELKDIWPIELWKFDLTEIKGLDNLHAPEGCIKEAQLKAAQLYGAKQSFFLVNGSSVGLYGAVLALCHQKPVFVSRHVHKSIYNGLILADAEPIYLPVTIDENLGIPLGIETEILEKFIKKYPDCKTLILPNPTYQGLSYNIKEIINLAKKKGLQVLVDEAHGSHFNFHPLLPPSGLSLGGDIVVQSWHKTLPVLTQGSILHVGKEYQGPDISLFLNMLQTTSPSYLIMASLDACRAFMENNGYKLLENTIQRLEDLKKQLINLKHLNISYKVQALQDPLKLIIYSKKLSGYQIEKILREKYKIFAELADENYCLLILGIGIKDEQIKKLKTALDEIDFLFNHLPPRKQKEVIILNKIPQRVMSPKKAFYTPKEVVSLDKAQGRIAGDYIIKYPPGIPLVVPGEVIDKEIFKILKNAETGFEKIDNIVVLKE